MFLFSNVTKSLVYLQKKKPVQNVKASDKMTHLYWYFAKSNCGQNI